MDLKAFQEDCKTDYIKYISFTESDGRELAKNVAILNIRRKNLPRLVIALFKQLVEQQAKAK